MTELRYTLDRLELAGSDLQAWASYCTLQPIDKIELKDEGIDPEEDIYLPDILLDLLIKLTPSFNNTWWKNTDGTLFKQSITFNSNGVGTRLGQALHLMQWQAWVQNMNSIYSQKKTEIVGWPC